VVLVDTKPGSFEMDYQKMADAITERTKVVIPVDLGGVPCDYDAIYAAVESKKHLFRPSNAIQKAFGRVIVLADAAHAFGARWHGEMVGSVADFTSFSFHAVKNLTTAEGGAMTWHLPFGNEIANDDINDNLNYFPTVPQKEGETWNELLYRLSQLFSLHGQNKDALAKTKLGAWEYDIIGPWYKCNMTDVMAAIGLVQLKRYPEMLHRRREIVGEYEQRLAGLDVQTLDHFPKTGGETASSGHLFITRLLGRTSTERNEVIVKMAERGIACNVHYKPLPMMTAYKALGFDIKNYPNAYDMFHNEVTLPLHTRLTDDMVEYVISNYVDIIKSL
jgi:dTDP-4-amino-4,6-dideoxygalactose transaminase